MVADFKPPRGKAFTCDLVPRVCSSVFYAFGELEKHEKEEHPAEKRAKEKKNQLKKPVNAFKKQPRVKGQAALNDRKVINPKTIAKLAAKLAQDNVANGAPNVVPTVVELAVIKIQAAIRGYMARNTFQMLRGLALAAQVAPEKAITFYNLSSKAGVQGLDNHLKTRSYITGYQASKDDIAVHAALEGAPFSEYVNVSRWFNHIEALLWISGVSAEGSGVSVEGLAGKVTDGQGIPPPG